MRLRPHHFIPCKHTADVPVPWAEACCAAGHGSAPVWFCMQTCEHPAALPLIQTAPPLWADAQCVPMVASIRVLSGAQWTSLPRRTACQSGPSTGKCACSSTCVSTACMAVRQPAACTQLATASPCALLLLPAARGHRRGWRASLDEGPCTALCACDQCVSEHVRMLTVTLMLGGCPLSGGPPSL